MVRLQDDPPFGQRFSLHFHFGKSEKQMTGRMDVSVGCRRRNWCLLSCLSPCRRSSWVCRAHCGLSGRAGSGAIEGAVGFLLLGRGYGDTLTGRDPANTHPYGGLNESRRWSWPPYLCGLDVHCPPNGTRMEYRSLDSLLSIIRFLYASALSSW